MSRYETARYKVILKEGDFEIRLYDTYYTASVEEHNFEEQSGFGQLFNYISGKNEKEIKIPMTVPVFNEMSSEHKTTEFFIPYEISESEIPKPDNSQIRIKKIDQHTAAVVSFSGIANESSIKKHIEGLLKWLEEKQYKTSGNFILARYNPPLTLPPLRRNEIIISIKE